MNVDLPLKIAKTKPLSSSIADVSDTEDNTSEIKQVANPNDEDSIAAEDNQEIKVTKGDFVTMREKFKPQLLIRNDEKN